jgi:hypothetical protein
MACHRWQQFWGRMLVILMTRYSGAQQQSPTQDAKAIARQVSHARRHADLDESGLWYDFDSRLEYYRRALDDSKSESSRLTRFALPCHQYAPDGLAAS